MRALDIAGAHAVYDLAGTELVGGRQVAPRRLLRSGYVAPWTDSTIRTLVDYGVTAIVDLRSAHESATTPHTCGAAGSDEKPYYRRISLGGDVAKPDPSRWMTLADLYRDLVARNGVAVWAVIGQLLARDVGATVVHCHTGRDRTGIIAGLVLRAAGATDARILDLHREVSAGVADYVAARRAAWLAKGRDAQYFDALNNAADDALAETFCWIDSTFGSTAEYLTAHGAPGDIGGDLIRWLTTELVKDAHRAERRPSLR